MRLVSIRSAPIVAGLIGLLAFMGLECTSVGVLQAADRETHLIPAPADVVWEACLLVAQEEEYHVELVEKDSGRMVLRRELKPPVQRRLQRIGTQPFVVPSPGTNSEGSLVLSTRQQRTRWDKGWTRLDIRILPRGNEATAIHIESLIEAYEWVVSHDWHVWRSNGALERSVTEMVKTRVIRILSRRLSAVSNESH